MSEHLQIKIIIGFNREEFEEKVNFFLKQLGNRVKDIQYQMKSNGAFTVMIVYWC